MLWFFNVLWVLLYISDEVNALRCQLNQDRDGLLISSFCQPRLYSPEAAMSHMRYNPDITLFKLSLDAGNMLVPLHERKDSAVFCRIWRAELRRVVDMGRKLTVDQIVQSIWRQSNNIWEAFCRGMVGTCNQ